MDFETMIINSVTEAITEEWMQKRLQEEAKKAVDKILEEQFSWRGPLYKKITRALEEGCERSLGGLDNLYLPRLEVLLSELIETSLGQDKRRLLLNTREMVDDGIIPVAEKGHYQPKITLGQIFDHYCDLVSKHYDTSDRKVISDGGNAFYQDVNCRAWIEPREEQFSYSWSKYQQADLHLCTDDGEDENGAEWNFTIPLMRKKETASPWEIRSFLGRDITIANLWRANPMACYLARLHTVLCVIEDDSEIFEKDVALVEEP